MELTGTRDALSALATAEAGGASDVGWDRPAGWAEKEAAATPAKASAKPSPAPSAAPSADGTRTPGDDDGQMPRIVNVLLDPLPPEDGGDEGPEGTDGPDGPGGGGAPGAASAFAPQDYEFAFPQGFAPDQGLVDEFRAFAAREGIAPELARKLAAFQAKASLGAQADLNRRAMEELRRDWGRDFGRNVREVRGAVRFVDAQLPGFAEWANTAAGSSAEFMRFLHWLGGQVREDSLLDGPTPPRSEEMTTLEFVTEAFRRAARGED